jgi:mRNA interferase HigB
MRVHLIKKITLKRFAIKHPSAQVAVNNWLTVVKYADWEKSEDIKATFNSVDFLGGGTRRVVFNLGGNHFRLIAKCLFGEKEVHLFICWIGTHKEYDTICKEGKQYTISDY